MITPVILAGGSGSRLWPLSHEGYPKQFLSLSAEFSMLQQTLERVKNLSSTESIVVCNDEHRFIVAEQLRGKSNVTILIEPEGKNTAPSIALAAFQPITQHPENAPTSGPGLSLCIINVGYGDKKFLHNESPDPSFSK